MKLAKFVSFLFKVYCLTAILTIVGISQLMATTDTIKFGGSLGFAFSPNTMNVHVGDTIVWSGNFGFHEIQNDTKAGGIPDGAAAFGPSKSTDLTLLYVVTVPGHYKYQCNPHAASGMIGSFDAVTANVNQVADANLSLEQSYPNPANGVTTIKYTLLRASEVQLSISNIEGKVVKTIINKFQGAGSYETQLDVTSLTSGSYIYQLQAGDAILSRQLIVVKK